MKNKIDKIAELEFNSIVTIKIIEMYDDLKDVFMSDLDETFEMVKESVFNKSESEEVESLLLEVFNKIILTREEFIEKYTNNLSSLKGKLTTSKEVKTDVVKVEPKPEETPLKKVKNPKEEETKVKIPRRYGLLSIRKDIEKQGGVQTPLQRAMIASNDLKNLYVNIDKRLIKDYFTGETNITENEYRMLIKAINTVKYISNQIIKK